MKPLNLDNSPCTPISSNCVIWQGPNIPCIKLCTGDTVSDVVFKLATELCEILEQLNVSNYDLACLNLAGCDPKDFQTLIQILINKICDLQNTPVPVPDDKSGGCPIDCIVEVAECFGGGTDNLVDYVDRIGKKICDLIDDITELTNQFNSLVLVTQNLQEQIDNIPTYTLPSIDPECQIGVYSSATPLDVLFEAFLNDVWCPFTNVTGTSSQLSSAITSQCVTGANTALEFQYSLTSPANQLGVYYSGSWVNSPATIADAIKNIWIALCDVRKAGKEKTVVAAGTGVTVTSATAVVGNDQVTTYTVNSASNIAIKDEGTTLTTSPSSINFVGSIVNSTAIGSDVTVTVNPLGGMLAQDSQPANLESLPFTATAASEFCRLGSIGILPEIYDDYNEYDPTSGIWTCATSGRYNLSCYAHYSRNVDGVGWYNNTYATSNKLGMFGVGVFGVAGCAYYCANFITIGGPIIRLDVTAQAMGMQINAGTELCVKVWNLTGFDYTGFEGDVLRFSVQRVK